MRKAILTVWFMHALAVMSAATAAPDYQQTPQWKYLQALNGLTFQCQIKLPILRDTLRYQGAIPNDRLDDFNRCTTNAYSKADSGLHTAIPPGLDSSVAAAVKKMYSTWRANLSGLSPYQPEDPQTKRDLDQAMEALRVELMTR